MTENPAAAVSPVRRHRAIWVLNAACPSRCTYCDIDSQRSVPTLSAAEVERVCQQLLAEGFREVIFVGGEPLLSPELPVAVRALAGRCSIAVFTGGLPGDHGKYLDVLRCGVDRVVLSMDSGRAETNDLVRGRRGITADLSRLARAIRDEFPRIGVSVNTVVSRHNADSVADVWERVASLGLDSWSLTLAGDNFESTAKDSLLSLEQLERLYFTTIPRLAAVLAPSRVELVVLPVPFPLLAGRVPPARFADAPEPLRAAIMRELEAYSRGDYNRTFVERCGCPLVGVDVSIGVGGEVYPCSQAPALKRSYVVGNLREASLSDVLAGDALGSFRAGLPQAPCARCWAPSNIERSRLDRLLARPE